MKYLLGLILLVSVSASAQYSPTAAKTRFVNGIGLGTKDTLTMNAADTVAMIVGRDSLVYFRYKGYWKPLAYNSSLTGYVPYTGATGSVNLGSYNLTANKIAIGGSISAVALDVHRAGSIVARIENTNSSQDALFAYAQSAQNVWFTGIDYASGANNFGFYYSPDGTTVIRKAYFSNSGDLTANSFIKSGGTSSQFLKADGSVTTIIPSGSIDTGRAATAIATGGSLNKVRDSLVALNASKYVPYTGATTNVDLGTNTFTSGTITSNGNTNTFFNLGIKNINSGTSAGTNFQLGNDVSTNAGGLTLFSSTYTTGSGVSSQYKANGVYIYSNRTGGITLNSEFSTSNIYLSTNSTLALKIDSIQRVLIPNLSTAGIVTNASTGQLSTSNGTGFIKMSGGAVSYDNSTYAPSSAISGTINYIPKFTSSSAIGNSNLINDAAGILGLGVVPSAWEIGIIQQIGTSTALWNYLNTTYLTNNRYYNSGNKYLTNGFSSSYEQNSTGDHVWANAPNNTSGVGAALTLTQRMTLFNDGNLSIGNTNDIYKIDVNGTAMFRGNLYLNQNSGGYTEQDFQYGGVNKASFYWENGTTSFNYYTVGTHKFTGVINTTSRLNVNGATDDGSTALNVTGAGKFSGNVQIGTLGGGTGTATPNNINLTSTFSTTAGSNLKLKLFEDTGGNVYGIGVSNGQMDFNVPSGASYRFFTGAVTLSSLAGTGSRIVVADASGTLSATTAASTSGTYTPTITLVTNAASSTARVCQYMRVGSVVTVSGYVTVTATTPAASSRIYMSLPISSSFTSTAQAGGAGGVPGGANIGTVIFANSTSTTVSMDFLPVSGATDYWFTYTYQIL